MSKQYSNRFDEVLCAVEELGLFGASHRIDTLEFEGAAVLEGEISIDGHEAKLWLVLDDSFPLTLPRFFLRPWDALDVIPHVDHRGMVCFADPEGLVLDRRRPIQIVQEAFERAVRVLTDGVKGRNRADFADEFEAYWRQLPGIVPGHSLLDPEDTVMQVIVAIDKEKNITVASSEKDISAFCNGANAEGKFVLHRAIYLPLGSDKIIVPPRHDRAFWTAKEARNTLLASISSPNRVRLQKLLEKRTYSREYIIMKLPRPSGGATIFGIQYDGIRRQHPLRKDGTVGSLIPLKFQRLDRSYLIQRGGGIKEICKKRVLLVGCGAVGGHLAFHLARAGVLNLTLVDHDTLIPENSFRHVLGRRYWNRKKVEALKEELELELPYVQITAIPNTIEKSLAAGSIKIANYDLLVLAVGNPTVELEINEQVHALQNRPAVVFTWLEPLGIGGHALLTGNASDGGCFECLYTATTCNVEFLENRAAFAATGQSFGRALSGCGSLFTPYGSMDASKTASIAARLAVDVLTGKEKGNPLISWKGDASDFVAQGFRLSSRFSATEEDLRRYRYGYKSAQCRVCSPQVKMVS